MDTPINNAPENVTSYPTGPDTDGFFIESESDAAMNIFTRQYENGNKVKKCLLPVLGKTAVVRQMLARDSKEVARFTGGDAEQYQMACITVATTFDGSKMPIEAIEVIKFSDYTLLITMCQALNF
nr:hypothetical protein [uncultured Chitinophaga sp.]